MKAPLGGTVSRRASVSAGVVVSFFVFAVLAAPSGSGESLRAIPPRSTGMGIAALPLPPIMYIREAAEISAASTLASATKADAADMRRMKIWNEAGMQPTMTGFARPLSPTVDFRATGVSAQSKAEAEHRGVLVEASTTSTTLVTSVGVESARRLRLHLNDLAFPADTRFAVWSDLTVPIGFGLELLSPGQMDLWTPPVEGSRIYIQASWSSDTTSGGATIDSVAELFDSPSPLSDSCLIDATCVTTANFDSIEFARDAVGYMNFMSGGQAYACTGTLINTDTASTPPPYFLTANHCVGNQTVASSLTVYFKVAPTACGGIEPKLSTLPATYGSTLMAAGASSDYSLLRLASEPPNLYLLGWDPRASAVGPGTLLFRVSHPATSDGTGFYSQAYSTAYVDSGATACSGAERPNFLYSDYRDGSVWHGSSGSAALIAGGYIVGQLLGGCGDSDSDPCARLGTVVDGAFAQTYNQIASYIRPNGASTPPQVCSPTATTACALNNRFRVVVRYRGAFDNNPADTNAQVKSVVGFASANYETVFFYFNNPNNIEMMVKILDQGNTNSLGQPTIAVLYGSATPLRIELTITDTQSGASKTYTSPFGTQLGATDFTAFVK